MSWTASLLLWSGLLGCGGGAQDPDPPWLDPELIDQSWVVENSETPPLKAGPGWISLIAHHDYKAAVVAFGGDGGLATARSHADAAALYRQAAWLVSVAILTDDAPQPTEAIAHLIAGDRGAARSVGLQDAWGAWIASPAPWPPPLNEVAPYLPQTRAGTWPTHPVRGADPGPLVALALWHEAAAMRTAGPLAPSVQAYGGRHRLPVEARAPLAELPLSFLVGSDYLGRWDAAFLNDALASSPVAAEGRWSQRSLLASLSSGMRRDGTLDPELALERSAELHDRVLSRSAEWLCTGKYSRVCADMARVAVLQNLALLAQAEANRSLTGELRSAALDRDRDDPVWLLSTSAWDLQEGSPLRALDVVPDLAKRYETLGPCLAAVKLHEP